MSWLNGQPTSDMSAIPHNGLATALSVQLEQTLAGVADGGAFELAGRTAFSWDIAFPDKTFAVDVFRNQTAGLSFGRYYQGKLEVEVGLNSVVLLILKAFFEAAVVTGVSKPILGEGGEGELGEGGEPILEESGSGLTLIAEAPEGAQQQLAGEGGEGELGEGGEPVMEEAPSPTSYTPSVYTLTSQRLQALKSLKIGLEYFGGSVLVFSGVVVNSVSLTFRMNQTPRMVVDFMAAAMVDGTSPALGTAASVVKHLANPASCSLLFDGAQLDNVYDATFTFIGKKLPAQFGLGGSPSRFVRDGGFAMQAQFGHYYAPGSPLLPALRDQAPHSIGFTAPDPTGLTSRSLAVFWPLCLAQDGTPDGVAAGDFSYRANFMGLQASAEPASPPGLTMVV